MAAPATAKKIQRLSVRVPRRLAETIRNIARDEHERQGTVLRRLLRSGLLHEAAAQRALGGGAHV